MRVYTDDEMFRVDRTYLGPKGKRFPWRATYRAYGVWLMVLFALAMVMLRLGVSPSLNSVVLLLMVSVAITIWFMKHIDADRPLRALSSMVWHELTAPRPVTSYDAAHSYQVGAKAPRWQADAQPRVRWWQRSRDQVHGLGA